MKEQKSITYQMDMKKLESITYQMDMKKLESITNQELLRLGRRDGWWKDIKVQEPLTELYRIDLIKRLLEDGLKHLHMHPGDENDPERLHIPLDGEEGRLKYLHILPGDESAISSLRMNLQRSLEEFLSRENKKNKKEEESEKDKRRQPEACADKRTIISICKENKRIYEECSKYSAMEYVLELKRFRAVRDFYTIDVDEDPQSTTIRRIKKVKKGELSGFVESSYQIPVKPFGVNKHKLFLTEDEEGDLRASTEVEEGEFNRASKDLLRRKGKNKDRCGDYLVYQWLDYDSSFSGEVVLAVKSYNDICFFRKSTVSGSVILKAAQIIDSSIKVIDSDIKVRKSDTKIVSSYIINTIIKYESKIVCDRCHIERGVEIANSVISSKELKIRGTTRISNSILNTNYLDIAFDTGISWIHAISPDSSINITNSHISGFNITDIPEKAYITYVRLSSQFS